MAKTYKAYLDAGHGGSDPGAVKYLRESKVNLVEALACRDYLKANGVSTKMSRTTDKNTNLNSICAAANKWGADIAVSFHNNAGGGDGFEAYCSINGGKGRELAKCIEAEVKKIGQNSRGVKTKKGKNGDYYGFIRMTNMPAVICEGVFVDNKTDVKIADTVAEQKEFGYAYARGILKYLGLPDNGISGKQDAKTTKKVTKAATKYKTSSYAKKIKTGLKTLGYFDGPIDSYVTPEYNEAVLKFQKKAFTRAKDRDGIGGNDTLIAVQTFVNFKDIKYFEPKEFRCNCGHCTGYPAVVDLQLLTNLDYLRKDSKSSITITSGLRCKWKNSRLPGSSSTSKHMTGKAADFYNSKLTGTKAKRTAMVKRWYTYKNASYSYANTPGMGNAVHVDVK